MNHRVDPCTTIFSPDGRLYQVEYAMESIYNAPTCLGIVATDGIVLATECRHTNSLQDTAAMPSERMYKINENLICAVTGTQSDATVLINELRLMSLRYQLIYNEIIPCEQIVTQLSDIKHAYTQYGGKRPFGVSFLYVGWDSTYGHQLYQSDPSGNFTGWKATCIGTNFNMAMDMLKEELANGKQIKVTEAMDLAIKVLLEVMGPTKTTSSSVQMATLQRIDNATVICVLDDIDVDELIKKFKYI
ncbi:proteasome subunit alpha type-4-like [Drosophila tropicalis]|uniref:proteasome subunit alpha type-4-like n=1 Tax=Drosophila tropicalis TaxID=46794 RepID=UPI0035AB904C